MSTLFLRTVALILAAIPASAQIPNTLLHSIAPPPNGIQSGAKLGRSVGVEGNYVVVGTTQDDTGEIDSGVVKVFHATTGALLFIIPNPSPANLDSFGCSVAISGTRVVVGA